MHGHVHSSNRSTSHSNWECINIAAYITRCRVTCVTIWPDCLMLTNQAKTWRWFLSLKLVISLSVTLIILMLKNPRSFDIAWSLWNPHRDENVNTEIREEHTIGQYHTNSVKFNIWETNSDIKRFKALVQVDGMRKSVINIK